VPGEADLRTLLRTMAPRLDAEPYVYATVPIPMPPVISACCRGTFREDEGMTAILSARDAERHGLRAEPLLACLTLTVESSLLAVGFLARIATALADAGISVNPMAGYYHDHLFVPWPDRDRALEVLRALAVQHA
jgi:hypothetical protein